MPLHCDKEKAFFNIMAEKGVCPAFDKDAK